MFCFVFCFVFFFGGGLFLPLVGFTNVKSKSCNWSLQKFCKIVSKIVNSHLSGIRKKKKFLLLASSMSLVTCDMILSEVD